MLANNMAKRGVGVLGRVKVCVSLYGIGAFYRRDDINWCWLQTSNL